MNFYRAFGLTIASDIPIEILPELAPPEQWDVTIRRERLDWAQIGNGEEHTSVQPNDISFTVPDCGVFRIQDGCLITVDAQSGTPDGLVCVYLLGSCMGAVMHQRGLFLLHGSCVARGDDAIIITGDSGAGKSTLAAEFLKNGWELLTDDVSLIEGIEGKNPRVHSSYPSQKLWQDAISRYDRPEEQYLLYQEQRRDKFHVGVSSFREGSAALRMVVRLIPVEGDVPCQLDAMKGMSAVNQFMYNTYRYYYLTKEQRQKHFARCVALGQQIPIQLVFRGKECPNSAPQIYEALTQKL